MKYLKWPFKQRVEDWERGYINTITMQMLISATIGTLVATSLAFLLRKFSAGDISPEILFIPWGIALVLGISTAFHQGVLAERSRILKVQAGPPETATPKEPEETKKPETAPETEDKPVEDTEKKEDASPEEDTDKKLES